MSPGQDLIFSFIHIQILEILETNQDLNDAQTFEHFAHYTVSYCLHAVVCSLYQISTVLRLRVHSHKGRLLHTVLKPPPPPSYLLAHTHITPKASMMKPRCLGHRLSFVRS